VAFGLGAFAAAAALRQLVLAARASRRVGNGWWRGVMGRTNGGMVVHLGVVIVAVAFTSSMSFVHRAEFRLRPGQSAQLASHRVTFVDVRDRNHRTHTAVEARVRVDGDRIFTPALSKYPFASQAIETPSVRIGLRDDVYVRLVAAPTGPGGAAIIGLVVTPLVSWLWIGGGVMALGTLLALVPGKRRRRPTEPASAAPDEDTRVKVLA
jgi:cytochrome c-type biogenesis protein CcmF